MAIGTPALLKELSVNSTGQAALALVLNTAASVGDLVVVCLAFGKASSPGSYTVTDTGGNTWQTDRRDDKTTSQTPHTAIFSTVLTTALAVSDTITVTPDVTINYPIAAAYKVTGVASSGWLDQAGGGQGVSASPSSGSVTTTQADEILFGAICSGAGQNLTPGTGWTELTDTKNTTKGLAVQYRIESSTGSYTSDGTLDASADWTDSIVSYKAAGAGTTYTKAGKGSAALAGAGPDVDESVETGTVRSGAVGVGSDAVILGRASAGVARLAAAGADVHTAVETGIGVSALTAAGADVTETAETGTAAVQASATGADAHEATETGAGAIGATASGTSEHTTGGGTTYTKAGKGSSGLASTGADAAIAVETGAAITDAAAAGQDSHTAAETATGTVGAAAAGTHERERPRAGAATAGASASGTRVVIRVETGKGAAQLSARTARAVIYSETGTGAAILAVASPSGYEPSYVALHPFDPPRPAGTSQTEPGHATFDPPQPATL